MLARLYHHLEEPDRATAVLERHLREHPLAADLTHINILAELYMEHGNHQAAVDLIQRAGTHMCGATGLPIDLQVTPPAPLLTSLTGAGSAAPACR